MRWAHYSTQILAKAQGVLDRLKSACGLDLVAVLDGFSVALADSAGTPHGAAILHGLSRAQVKTCVDHHEAGVTVTIDGDLTLLTMPTGELATTFLDDSTLLVVSGPTATKAGITSLLQQTATIGASVTFSEMWKLIDKHASGWFLINASSAMMATLKSLTPDALAVFASIRVTENLALDGRVRTQSPASATMLVAMIKPQLPQAASLFTSIDVTVDANDAHLVFAMAPEQIEELA